MLMCNSSMVQWTMVLLTAFGIAWLNRPGARLWAWLDPTDLFSIGTCLVQWGALLTVGLVLNRWLARRTGGERSKQP